MGEGGVGEASSAMFEQLLIVSHEKAGQVNGSPPGVAIAGAGQ